MSTLLPDATRLQYALKWLSFYVPGLRAAAFWLLARTLSDRQRRALLLAYQGDPHPPKEH